MLDNNCQNFSGELLGYLDVEFDKDWFGEAPKLFGTIPKVCGTCVQGFFNVIAKMVACIDHKQHGMFDKVTSGDFKLKADCPKNQYRLYCLLLRVSISNVEDFDSTVQRAKEQS